jgi:hypothetical protein
MWDGVKAVLRGKLTALNICVIEEKSWTNDLSYYLKKAN